MRNNLLSEEDYLDSLLKSMDKSDLEKEDKGPDGELDNIEKDLFGPDSTYYKNKKIFVEKDLKDFEDVLNDTKSKKEKKAKSNKLKTNGFFKKRSNKDEVVSDNGETVIATFSEENNKKNSDKESNNKESNNKEKSDNDKSIIKSQNQNKKQNKIKQSKLEKEDKAKKLKKKNKEQLIYDDIKINLENEDYSDLELDNKLMSELTEIFNEETKDNDFEIEEKVKAEAFNDDKQDNEDYDNSEMSELMEMLNLDSNEFKNENSKTLKEKDDEADNNNEIQEINELQDLTEIETITNNSVSRNIDEIQEIQEIQDIPQINEQDDEVDELLKILDQKDNEKDKNKNLLADEIDEDTELLVSDELRSKEDEDENTNIKKKTKKVKKAKSKFSFLSLFIKKEEVPSTESMSAEDINKKLLDDFDKGELDDDLEGDKKKIKKTKKEKVPKEKKEKKEKVKKIKLPKSKEFNEIAFSLTLEGKVLLASIMIVLVIVVFFLGDYYHYNSKVANANNKYVAGNYQEAYEEIIGLEPKNDEVYLFEQIKILSKLDQKIQSFNNFKRMGNYNKAINALIESTNTYEIYKSMADQIYVLDKFNTLYNQALDILKGYEISESQAKEIYLIIDKNEYSKKINDITAELIKNGAFE